jgi:hypothetical protein
VILSCLSSTLEKSRLMVREPVAQVPGGDPGDHDPVAEYGSRELSGEPLLAALAPEPPKTARLCVSVGKKTVGRASRTPV